MSETKIPAPLLVIFSTILMAGVSCLQIIQPCFTVIEVSTISKRVQITDMRSIRNHVSVYIHNLVVTPRIVRIVYHNVPCVVKYRNNIPF